MQNNLTVKNSSVPHYFPEYQQYRIINQQFDQIHQSHSKNNPYMFDDYQARQLSPIGKYHTTTKQNKVSQQHKQNRPSQQHSIASSEKCKQKNQKTIKLCHNNKSPTLSEYEKRYHKLVEVCHRIDAKPGISSNKRNGDKQSHKKVINLYRSGIKPKHLIHKKVPRSINKQNSFSQKLFDFLKCDEQFQLPQTSRPLRDRNKYEQLHKQRIFAAKSCRSVYYDLDLPQIIENFQEELQKSPSQSRQFIDCETDRYSSYNHNDTINTCRPSKIQELPTTNNRSVSALDTYHSDKNQFLEESITPFSCQLLYDKQKLTQMSRNIKSKSVNKIQNKRKTQKIDVNKLIKEKDGQDILRGQNKQSKCRIQKRKDYLDIFVQKSSLRKLGIGY